MSVKVLIKPNVFIFKDEQNIFTSSFDNIYPVSNFCNVNKTKRIKKCYFIKTKYPLFVPVPWRGKTANFSRLVQPR